MSFQARDFGRRSLRERIQSLARGGFNRLPDFFGGANSRFFLARFEVRLGPRQEFFAVPRQARQGLFRK